MHALYCSVKNTLACNLYHRLCVYNKVLKNTMYDITQKFLEMKYSQLTYSARKNNLKVCSRAEFYYKFGCKFCTCYDLTLFCKYYYSISCAIFLSLEIIPS